VRHTDVNEVITRVHREEWARVVATSWPVHEPQPANQPFSTTHL